jgi:hypothetical protein
MPIVHYQLYTHQHTTKVVTTTRIYQWSHDMVANENSFRNGFLLTHAMGMIYSKRNAMASFDPFINIMTPRKQIRCCLNLPQRLK